MLSEKFRVGQRLLVDGNEFATVKFLGTVGGSEWLGIEFDNQRRGKHSGSHKGTSYFTTSVPGAGSFIKPKRTSLPERDFVQALKEKYAPHLTADSFIDLDGGLKVETVGWEKIARKQADLHNVHHVGLADCLIADAGDIGSLEPDLAVQDLDLSRNLIYDWNQVARIAQALSPRLESLRLNHNRFMLPDLHTKYPSFQMIKVLSLNATMVSWDAISSLAGTSCPSLQELHLGGNRIRTISSCSAAQPPFPNLTLLNLESNAIDSWDAARNAGSAAPLLVSLFLNENSLAAVLPHQQDAAPFHHLDTLNISGNPISNSDSLLALASYPRLANIRFKAGKCPDVAPGLESLDHGTLICLLQKATRINGSTVSARERLDAELYFVSSFHKREPSGAAVLRSVYDSLVSRHGVSAVPVHEARGTVVADRVVTLCVRLVGDSFDKVLSERDVKVPRDVGVRMLKAIVARACGIRAKRWGLYISEAQEIDDLQKSLQWYDIGDGDVLIAQAE
ncbi:MAG: hypothetical protein SGCHY_004047 [Lobulomycetales sp.]